MVLVTEDVLKAPVEASGCPPGILLLGEAAKAAEAVLSGLRLVAVLEERVDEEELLVMDVKELVGVEVVDVVL